MPGVTGTIMKLFWYLGIAALPALSAEFQFSGFSTNGLATFGGAFTNGIVTIESVSSLNGSPIAWQPHKNIFSTSNVTATQLSLTHSIEFYRALAVDLSGGRAGFTNLIESYSTLTTIAGAGGATGAGVTKWQAAFENGLATNAQLSRPHIAMSDHAGNIFIADKDAHGVRKVRSDGTIVTVAGTSSLGNGPDTSTLGTLVALNEPNGLWVRGDGTVYILDLQNGKIRRLDTNGFTTLLFSVPGGISSGRGLWVSDDEALAYVCSGTAVKRWTTTNGVTNFSTGFNQLGNLAIDPSGSLVVTDRGRHGVYRLSPTGVATRIAGNESTVNSPGGGDGGLATLTALNQVRAIWFLPTGAYFVGTDAGSQVWYVDVDGLIHLFLNGDGHAGDGTYFYNPTELRVSKVRQITSTPDGDLLITEHDAGYVRKVRFLRYSAGAD
jgi:streptogramin lyase